MLTDTGATVTGDSIAKATIFPRTTSDTATTITDSIASKRTRAIADTAATVTDTLVTRRVRSLTDTAATVTDTLVSRRARMLADAAVVPPTGLIDDVNRADDSSPPPGASWADMAGRTAGEGLVVLGNALTRLSTGSFRQGDAWTPTLRGQLVGKVDLSAVATSAGTNPGFQVFLGYESLATQAPRLGRGWGFEVIQTSASTVDFNVYPFGSAGGAWIASDTPAVNDSYEFRFDGTFVTVTRIRSGVATELLRRAYFTKPDDQAAFGTAFDTSFTGSPYFVAIDMVGDQQYRITNVYAGAVYDTVVGVKTLTRSLTDTACTISDSIATKRSRTLADIGVFGRVNLLPNGGFETNVNGYSGFGQTLARDTTEHQFGAASMKDTFVAGQPWEFGFASPYVGPIPAGTVVTGSAYIKGVGSTVGKLMTISIRSADGTHSGEVNLVLTNSWQRLSDTFTPTVLDPGGVGVWVFSNYTPTAGDIVYFDGIQLEYGPVATPYQETNGAAVVEWDTLVGAKSKVASVTDTGATISDSVSRSVSRSMSDTGAAVSDALVSNRVRRVTDTAATMSDSVARAIVFARTASDTGATITDSLASRRVRQITDTASTITDSIASSRSHSVSDTATTVTDTLVRSILGRGLTDMGLFTFPFNGILDDFNRANSTNLGANWTELGANGMEILSNQLSKSGASGAAYWNQAKWADAEVFWKLASNTSSAEWLIGKVRIALGSDRSQDHTQLGASSDYSGYYMRVQVSSRGCRIYRADGDNNHTVLAIFQVESVSVGDLFGLRAQGNKLTIFQKAGSLPWQVIGSFIDSTYLDAGRLELEPLGTSQTFDDFGGGATQVTDTVASKRVRSLTDTACTVTDSVSRSVSRSMSDTGATVTDAVASKRTRTISDTAATVTDTLASRRVRALTDTGATVSDSLVSNRSRSMTDSAASALQTLATDDFNRADNGDLGSSWLPISTAFNINSNHAIPSLPGGDCEEKYTAVGFPSDQYAEAVISGLANDGGGGAGIGVALRMSNSGVGDGTFYRIYVSNNLSYDLTIDAFVGGAYQGVLYQSLANGPWSDGSVLRAQIVGNQIRVFKDGALVASISNALISSGTAGIAYSSGATGYIDSWAGGSVAGVTDSVVAQKNGGVANRNVTDTGATISDSVSSSRTRSLTDTGATVTDTTVLRVTRMLTDTGASVVDSAVPRQYRAVTDTALTLTEAISVRPNRMLSDTAATITDSIVKRRVFNISDVAVVGSLPSNVIDDFNRADTGPPAGPNWTDASMVNGSPGLVVAGNRLTDLSGGPYREGGYYNAATFGPNLVAMWDLAAGGGNDNAGFVAFFRTATPGVGTTAGYAFQVRTLGAILEVSIWRVAGGVVAQTFRSTFYEPDFAPPEKWGVLAQGTLLALIRQTPGQDWRVVSAWNDGTYTSAGFFGFDILGATPDQVIQLDNLSVVTGSPVYDTVSSSRARTLSDTAATISDSIAPVRIRVRTLSDTGTTITDSVAKTNVFARTASDTGATITDSLASLRRRSISDTGATVTDTLVSNRVRTVSDTAVTQADSIARTAVHPRTATDTAATVSDSIASNRTRTITDTGATVTDSAAMRVNRMVADTGATFTDSIAKARLVTLTDTAATITDSIARTATHPRTATDTGATISDSLASSRSHSMSDTAVTASDSIAKTRTAPRSTSDTAATVTDSMVLLVRRMLADQGATIVDTAVPRQYRSVTDTGATVSDTLVAKRVRVLTDTGATVSDSLASRRVRVLTDTAMTFSDSVSTSAAGQVSITDTGVTLTDTLASRRVRAISDTAATVTGDSIAKAKTFVRSLTDTGATVSDSTLLVVKRIASDTAATISDSIAPVRIRVRAVSDTGLTLTDSIARTAVHFRSVSDTAATITDSVSTSAAGAVSITDTGLTLTDTMALKVSRKLTDTAATVTDTLVLTARRILTDTAATITSALALRVGRMLSDQGATIVDTPSDAIFRSITDTGATVSDSLASTATHARAVSDTAATITDSLAPTIRRSLTDTGATVTDATALRVTRRLTDTGASIFDFVIGTSGQSVTDTAVTLTDSIARTASHPRATSDQGLTLTDAISRRTFPRITDTGATVSDSVKAKPTRSLLDTGVTLTDSIQRSLVAFRTTSDTALVLTDTISGFVYRSPADVAVSMSDAIRVSRVTRFMTDVGAVVVGDSIQFQAGTVFRNISDTGLTLTDFITGGAKPSIFPPVGLRILDTSTRALVQDPEVEAAPERDLIGVA